MDYEYKDQHFSVEIAEALLSRPQVSTTGSKIETIRTFLLDNHLKKGGFGLPDSEDDDIFDTEKLLENAIVDQTLLNLSKKAKASCIHKDLWRIAKGDQWIFGTGKHWIYLYYFPQEKRDAEEKGRSMFPCKIGKTDGVNKKGKIKYDAPEKRVETLTRGAREFAKNALLLRTNSHTTLETAIHKNLELKGKSIGNRPSKEWFRTNPRQVVEIVAEIEYSLLSPVNDLWAILADIK